MDQERSTRLTFTLASTAHPVAGNPDWGITEAEYPQFRGHWFQLKSTGSGWVHFPPLQSRYSYFTIGFAQEGLRGFQMLKFISEFIVVI